MGRLLGIDYGTSGLGLAVGNLQTRLASPVGWRPFQLEGRRGWGELLKVLADWEVDLCVVGLPLSLDGEPLWITPQVRRFAKGLAVRGKVRVSFQDERLSTVAAREILFSREGRSGLGKARLDAASAVIILQDFLNNPELDRLEG